MLQTGVFVDAGYLFAQGGQLVAGTRTARSELVLNVSAAATKFRELAADAAPDARLLRIYWYDGLIRGGQPTAEQLALARSDNIKLRFGMVNSQGQQKGVDSLIVTDLIELARNHAISDAVILSGDEDVRVGVQIAATFGVRIHLVGIKPALGSQSPELVAEADTHREWTAIDIAACLSLQSAQPLLTGAESERIASVEAAITAEVAERLAAINRQQIAAAVEMAGGTIPGEVDRPALASLRVRLGRQLTEDEKRAFRTRLRHALTTNAPVAL